MESEHTAKTKAVVPVWQGFKNIMKLKKNNNKNIMKFMGCLGGSVLEHLPLAQVMILGSWERVLHRVPRMEPASPSACVSASLSVFLMNK